jgi:PAS domain S-box-containing protein
LPNDNNDPAQFQIRMNNGTLEYGGKRALMMDVAGGLYSLKRTLRADIGFFEKDFMFKAGLGGAREFLSSLRADGIPDDPEKAILSLLDMYARRGFGRFNLVSIDKSTKTVEISSDNAGEAWAFLENHDLQREPVCAYTSGVLTWICRLAFARDSPDDSDLMTHESQCIAQGAKQCLYTVAPEKELSRRFPEYEKPKGSIAEHELMLNEEILVKNLELQGMNLALERQVRKRTEELWRAEENYNSLMRHSPDAVAVVLLDGRLHSINQAGARALGIDPPEEAQNLKMSSLLSGKNVTWDRIIWILEKEGAISGLETEFTARDGKKVIGLLSARFANMLPGKCVELVFKDVTESKLLERRMEEARSESDLLIDLLSHDIMNYTFSALHFLNKLWNSPTVTQTDKETLAPIIKDIQGTYDLCASVRDLSQIRTIESDGLSTKDLNSIIAEAVVDVKRMFSDRTVTVNFRDSDVQHFAKCSSLTPRIFTNLLSNAVKYDHHPEPVVEITVSDFEENGRQYWRAEVSDNGKGIPDEEKERVFQRFHRTDTSVPGTGLGLFVARAIAEASGGRLWAENRVQGDYTKGTTMVVLLPKAANMPRTAA